MPAGADDPGVPRFAVATRVLGCLLLVAGLAAVLGSLGMQFHIENTDAAIYESAVGRDLLAVAWLAVPLGIGAIVARRELGLPMVVAGVVLLALAGADARSRMHPEAGERRAAAAFVAPAGATPADSPFDGYDFPTFRRSWSARGDLSGLCAAAGERLAAWADTAVTPLFGRRGDSCSMTASRGRHEGTVFVHSDYQKPLRLALELSVTRR
jgi:hypothetical protein